MKYAFLFAFFGVLVLLNLFYGGDKTLQNLTLKNKEYYIEAYKNLHQTYIKAYVFNTCQVSIKAKSEIDLYDDEFQKRLIDFIQKDLGCIQK